jgi:hypothetical protein
MTVTIERTYLNQIFVTGIAIGLIVGAFIVGVAGMSLPTEAERAAETSQLIQAALAAQAAQPEESPWTGITIEIGTSN